MIKWDGDDENKQESKNPEADERNVGPGTARNTEEPQGTPLMQSYVSNILTTQVMKEWVMSTIEDNSATPRFPSSVRAWMESSKHGEDEKSRNMINVHLAHEKSKIEHRSSNISCPVGKMLLIHQIGQYHGVGRLVLSCFLKCG